MCHKVEGSSLRASVEGFDRVMSSSFGVLSVIVSLIESGSGWQDLKDEYFYKGNHLNIKNSKMI